MKSKKEEKKPRGNPGIVNAGITTRFKRGYSGNPGGRPSRTPYADAHRIVAALSVADLPISSGDLVAIGIAKAVAREALKGRIPAAVEAASRTEGKPREIDKPHEQAPVEKLDLYTTLQRIREFYRLADDEGKTEDAVAETPPPRSPKDEAE
jgi:hypothetical protein